MSPLPIIDAHMHLWDLTHNHYPWLQEKSREMWIGDYSSLKRDYLVDSYLDDIEGLGVVKSIHLQAQWDHSDPIGETKWLSAVARAHGFPHGIVGFCDLSRDDVEEVLDGHLQYANIRGIRMDINWHPDPFYRFCARGDYLTDAKWQHGLSQVARRGLSFDLQIYAAHQAEDAYEVVRRFSDLQFILDHSGAPSETDAAGRERWLAGLRRLSTLPNLVTKLSGFDMFDHQWTVDSLRQPIMSVLELFGTERCLFASNFPVSSLYRSYEELLGAHQAILSGLSADEQRAIFHDNAARVYRV